MLCDDNAVQVALDNASGKKFLDPGGKNIKYLTCRNGLYQKFVFFTPVIPVKLGYNNTEQTVFAT